MLLKYIRLRESLAKINEANTIGYFMSKYNLNSSNFRIYFLDMQRSSNSKLQTIKISDLKAKEDWGFVGFTTTSGDKLALIYNSSNKNWLIAVNGKGYPRYLNKQDNRGFLDNWKDCIRYINLVNDEKGIVNQSVEVIDRDTSASKDIKVNPFSKQSVKTDSYMTSRDSFGGIIVSYLEAKGINSKNYQAIVNHLKDITTKVPKFRKLIEIVNKTDRFSGEYNFTRNGIRHAEGEYGKIWSLNDEYLESGITYSVNDLEELKRIFKNDLNSINQDLLNRTADYKLNKSLKIIKAKISDDIARFSNRINGSDDINSLRSEVSELALLLSNHLDSLK